MATPAFSNHHHDQLAAVNAKQDPPPAKKDYDLLKARIIVSTFSNKAFLN